jgi:hypothetical protein
LPSICVAGAGDVVGTLKASRLASVWLGLRTADDVEVSLLNLRFLPDACRGCERCLTGFMAGLFLGVCDGLATRDPDLSIFHVKEVCPRVNTANG